MLIFRETSSFTAGIAARNAKQRGLGVEHPRGVRRGRAWPARHALRGSGGRGEGDVFFLATSLILAQCWLGASDFTRLPCRFLYNRAFNVDSIHSNRSPLVREWLLPCKDLPCKVLPCKVVYVSRKLRASPIHVIDRLAITGNLERWKLDGVPVRILPQLIQALPA